MDGTIALIITLSFFIGFIVLWILLYRAGIKKAEAKAATALQAVLDPGEPLIEFTRVNTKGPSAATVFLAGAIGSAISRAGGKELYVGLTGRRLVLTPVKQGKENQEVQVIPVEEIRDFKVVGGMQGSSTLTAHTKNGDVVMHVSGSKRWLKKAIALQKTFANRVAVGD